jgi:spermidine synthase
MNRTWEVSDVLFETGTGFQDLLIGRTDQGISLFCDNERQSTEASQLVYHEALMVPGLLLADRIRRVLIIGSSEGVASQIAEQAGAELVDHADIDQIAVESCARYLPYGYSPGELGSAERGEGAVRMHYQDGFDFMADAAARGEAYDLVVIDLPDENTDPDAQHNRLYAKDFLLRCGEVLAPGGVLAAQAGCPTLWRNETLGLAYRRFTESFPTVLYYGSDEHEWAFLFARKDSVPDPVSHVRDRLPACAYRPSSVDDQALVANTVPPHAVRAAS